MRRLEVTPLIAATFSRLRGAWLVSLSDDHDSLHEGTTLGVAVATGIWVWLAVVDAVAGHPFQTFAALGGITAFTAVHYLLNIAFGVVIVSAIHGSAREPSLALALLFGLTMLEIAFAMLTVLFSHLGLGALAWIRIFGGSLVGVAIALLLLSRRHPLAMRLRYADREYDEYLSDNNRYATRL